MIFMRILNSGIQNTDWRQRAQKLRLQLLKRKFTQGLAKILNGRTVTSTPGIRDDIENAGAEWIDRPVVIDRNIISARRPPDLPEFGEAIVKYLRDH
jgi:putative intracellular protease/amidase